MGQGLHKDIRQVVEPLLREGFTLHRTRKHWQLRAPNGRDLRHLPGTPSSLYREVRRIKTWAARATTTTTTDSLTQD